MKNKTVKFAAIGMIALAGAFLSGCMPRVYDDNPHFSHHRVPPKPNPYAPAPIGPGHNVVVRPGTVTTSKPAPSTPAKPVTPTPPPSRPGTNNHR